MFIVFTRRRANRGCAYDSFQIEAPDALPVASSRLAPYKLCKANWLTVLMTAMVSTSVFADASSSASDEEKWAKHIDDTLGASLRAFEGVEARYFGGLSSSPVIRGFADERIALMSNGSSITDFSSYSARFNIALDPMRVNAAKLLYGVETLAYGSGLVGGAIDVDVPLVPVAPITGPEWNVISRGSDHNDGGAGFARLGLGNGRVAMRVDGLLKYSNDYRPTESEPPNSETNGELANTHGGVSSGGVGLSWTPEGGYFGLGYSQHNSEYGLGRTSTAGEAPRVSIDSRRYEMRAGIDVRQGGVESLSMVLTHSDYRHSEKLDNLGLTLSYAPTESGELRYTSTELRLSALMQELRGWQARIGIQAQQREEDGVDPFAETPTERDQAALYVIPQKQIGENVFSFGVRAQQVEQAFGEAVDEESKTPVDLWTALDVPVAGDDRVKFSVGRGQRAPSESELQNPASAIGSEASRLDLESSYNAGVAYRGVSQRVDYGIDLRASEINDYIVKGDEQGASRDDVRHYSAYASANFRFHPQFSVAAYGQAVRAEFHSGGYVPGIPGDRFGLVHSGVLGELDYRVAYSRVFEQDRVASTERVTEGYDELNLDLEYRMRWQSASLWLALRGRNLLDADLRGHQSQNPNKLPLPGARVYLDFRVQFESPTPRRRQVEPVAVAPSPEPVARPVRANTTPTEALPTRVVTQLAFARNSAQLTPRGRAQIDAIIPYLQQIGGHLVIEGHTDSIGDAAYNKALSLQRAQSVQAYLRGRGFAGEQMTVIGHGESRPVASNASEEGRARNRRVEFYSHTQAEQE